MSKLTTKYLILAAIILLSVAGGLIAVYTTANGPWGYSDPVVYIYTARSLDRGQGLVYYEADADFRPITIEPPFYSIVLGAIGLFQVNLVVAARWLNIFAFIASIFIAGWIFYRYSRVSALGIVASALMCAFPYMVVMFSSAYSEPLFILVFLSGGLGLLAYLQAEKTSLLLLSAVLIGLIPVTRYAGVAMILAGGASLLLLASGKPWARIRRAALFVVVASLPILVWLVWIYFSTAHSVGGRSVGMNLQGWSAQFQAFRGIFMDTVWKWVPFQSHELLLRYRLRFTLMGIVLAVILALVLLAVRRLRKNTEGTRNSGLQIFTFFGLSALIFLVVLLVTYLFTHPTIDVDNRMLLPLYVGSVMTFYSAFALWQAAWFRGKLRLLQILPWLIAALCVAWYIPQTRNQVQFYHPGDGLTAFSWDHSAIIQAVRDLPAGQAVISNDWELLQLWTGRPIYGFWNTFPSKPPIQAGVYGTAPGDPVQSVFCKQGAALVIFADFPSQFRTQVGEASAGQMPGLFAGLSVYGSYPDGNIYLCR
jgi:4-amino-4-deoxy-L-arabinose transferase-like glycosyltransferase